MTDRSSASILGVSRCGLMHRRSSKRAFAALALHFDPNNGISLAVFLDRAVPGQSWPALNEERVQA